MVANQVSTQVSGPNSVTYLSQTPLFEWGVLGTDLRQQKDMYLDWIKLLLKNC